MVIARVRRLWLCGLALCCAFDWPGQAERLTADLEQAGPRERREIVRLLSAMRAEQAHEAILAACSDGDPNVRREAMRGAALMDMAEAVPILLKALNDTDASLRTAAADALGRLRAASAEQALARVLSDSEASVRRAAVRALTKVRSDASLGALITSLDDADLDVRLETIRALADSPAPRVRDALLGKTRDAAPQARALALEAVTRVADPRAVAVLTQALEDPSDAVVLAAIRGLQKVAPDVCRGALAPLVSSARLRIAKAARSTLSALTDSGPDSNPNSKTWLWWLEQSATPNADAETVIAGLEETLPKGEALASEPLALFYPSLPVALRPRAVALMGRTRSPKAVDRLVELLGDPKPELRAAAAQQLAGLGNAKQAPVLVNLLDDTSAQVRAAARAALGKIADGATQGRLLSQVTAQPRPAHHASLLPALSSSLRRLRSELTAAQREALMSHLRGELERGDEAARAAMLALAEWGDAAAVAELSQHKPATSSLALTRVHALVRADHAAKRKALRALARAEDLPVRAAAIAGLGVVGEASDLELIRAAQSGPWPMGPVAAFALTSLTLRGLAPSALLCPLLEAKEPVTRHNARVGLLRKPEKGCPVDTKTPDSAHGDVGMQPLAHTWRVLVFTDDLKLIAYPDGDSEINLPDLTVMAVESPWKLPYGYSASRM